MIDVQQTSIDPGRPAAETLPPPALARAARSYESPGLLIAGTFISWLMCLVIGLLGLRLSHQRLRAVVKPTEPPHVEALDVEITNDPLPPDLAPAAPPELVQPTPAPAQAVPPDAPPLPAIAAPNPAIAFVVPVDAPPRALIPARVNATSMPTVRRITFGQGEGRQPAPEYPREAIEAGQEGVIVVRFDVAADGSVLRAEAATASRWPLLNQAAVRVVRDRWRFAAGPPRTYEVSIRFQLNRL